jgi:predicted enzyme related to lactoylglutathione lyase
MSGEPSFVELGVEDVERARVFYGSLFDWDLAPYGTGLTIQTPTVPGGLHGGDRGAGPSVYFATDDIEATKARVRELGGTVEEPDDVPDQAEVARFGRFARCVDDQGSPFGLHQPPA